jgi:hypothetical protein
MKYKSSGGRKSEGGEAAGQAKIRTATFQEKYFFITQGCSAVCGWHFCGENFCIVMAI